MAASNKLYPPIIDYSMPAFVINDSIKSTRIYFSLPVYNSSNDVKSVHMTVRYLNDNSSALGSGYPAKIKVCNINVVTAAEDSIRAARQDKYYVVLNDSDLTEGFVTGTVYKIQLRFSDLEYSVSNAGPGAGWFNQNLTHFSEWSTVSLIRPIDKPEYTILGLEEADTGASVSFTSLDSIFTVEYNQGTSHEPLKAWRAKLYSAGKDTLLADSGEIIYNTYNYLAPDEQDISAFDIILPYQMEADKDYVLEFYIETRNGYKQTTDFAFTCVVSAAVQFDGTIDFDINEEEGYALIHIENSSVVNNNIVIRRSSSESNFSIWEDVAVKVFAGENVNWTLADFTIESGVWYQYGVQIRDTRGRRGSLTPVSAIKMGEFENVFLLGSDGRQLKLKYDFNISSANITVSEAKTDTIGSKYPFVRRNGNMYYRTFQCTGLITGYSRTVEEKALFVTDKDLYHNNDNRYLQVRSAIEERVNQYDYTYEREFREKVQEFLYDDKVKLFKSLQEGNILVKLMNISLTPKNELGRLLYTFSAQAIEIGEPSLQNLNDYNIQVIGEYVSSINFSETRLGQISSFNGYDDVTGEPTYLPVPAGTNLIDEISKQYGWEHSESGGTNIKPINNNIVRDFQLTHLRVEFETPPYLIEKNGSTLTPFDDQGGTVSTINKDLVLGWLLEIDGTTILVQPPNNIYELKEPGLIFTSNSSIKTIKDAELSVYYTADLEQEIDNGSVPISVSYYNINGQLQRSFEPDEINENVVRLLQNKYTYSYKTTQWTFRGLITANIEADPGVVFQAKSNAAQNVTQFIINETGNLYLDPGIPNIIIDTLQFIGKEIDLRFSYNNFAAFEADHYIDLNTQSGAERFAVPLNFDYYEVDNEIKMFYKNKWYNLQDDSALQNLVFIIKCPVEAIINYQIQQEKGVYEQL